MMKSGTIEIQVLSAPSAKKVGLTVTLQAYVGFENKFISFYHYSFLKNGNYETQNFAAEGLSFPALLSLDV